MPPTLLDAIRKGPQPANDGLQKVGHLCSYEPKRRICRYWWHGRKSADPRPALRIKLNLSTN